MKYAVLGFSYHNFEHFKAPFRDRGHYSSNLGDNVQTIASKEALRACGVAPAEIVEIDRDTLPSYNGSPVKLLMNGVIFSHVLPTPPQIEPIFMGIHVDEGTIINHKDWFKRWEPIGCRDPETARIFKAYSIDAFATGCVSITLPRRTDAPVDGRLLIVMGWDDLLPPTVLKHIPPKVLDTAIFIQNRRAEGTLPLTEKERKFNETYVHDILRRYRDEASLVLTPLLHVASPCIGMGVPVIVCRRQYDHRFGHVKNFVPIYTPENFDHIDWQPSSINVEEVKVRYLEDLKSMLNRPSRWAVPPKSKSDADRSMFSRALEFLRI